MEGGTTAAPNTTGTSRNCNTTIMGRPLTQEPGAMSGPTTQGMDDLIARDPGAYWDTATNKVKGSAIGEEPAHLPDSAVRPGLLRQRQAQRPQRQPENRQLARLLHRAHQGNEVVGRITPIGGIRDAGPARRRPACPRRRSGWSSKHGLIDDSESRRGESPPALCSCQSCHVLRARARCGDVRRATCTCHGPRTRRTREPRTRFISVGRRRIRHRAPSALGPRRRRRL